MSEPFVPVPVSALEAVELADWGAVTDLYKRSHALGWRELGFTERKLAVRWGVATSRVWGILEALERAGLLTIRRGSKRKESGCLVRCPTRQAGSQDDRQNESDSGSEFTERVAQEIAKGDPGPAEEICEQSHNCVGDTPEVMPAVAKVASVWQDDRHNSVGSTNEVAESVARVLAPSERDHIRSQISSSVAGATEEKARSAPAPLPLFPSRPADLAADEQPTEGAPEAIPTVIDLPRRAALQDLRAGYVEALRVWNTEVGEALRSQGLTCREHARLSPHTGIGRILSLRIGQEGLAPVLSVLRWFARSEHERAVFLRKSGMGLDTLISAKHFAKYAGFAAEPEAPRAAAVQERPEGSIVARMLKERQKEAAK